MCTRVVQTNIGRDEAGEQVGPYQYDSFDAFLCDVRLVFTNAITYNAKHKGGVYDAASALLKSFEGEVKVAKKRLAKPSKSIKTLCTEMMNRLCSEVVDGQKAAASFMDPVDQKVFQTYRSFVTKPMDLRTIRVRATACTTVHVFACVCFSLWLFLSLFVCRCVSHVCGRSVSRYDMGASSCESSPPSCAIRPGWERVGPRKWDMCMLICAAIITAATTKPAGGDAPSQICYNLLPSTRVRNYLL